MKKDLTIQAQRATIEELKKNNKDLENSTFEQTQRINFLMKNNEALKNQRATIMSKYRQTDSFLAEKEKKLTSKELFKRSVESF